MKAVMVIPSYWAREGGEYKEGDAVYDHPTPIDEEGTLGRCLESIKVLKDKDFTLVLITATVAEELAELAERKTKEIVERSEVEVETLIFSYSHLKRLHSLLPQSSELLQLRGYSAIRNICIFLPHILSADIAVLIDDDEVFEDPDFMKKAKEFVGRELKGKRIDAVAGYYLQPDGDFMVKKEHKPWMMYWDQFVRMNEAFAKFIGREPRLKITPFVFGGNMVISRRLFENVCFDPNITRGEDIDYLINARLFGYNFFLDNKLSIKHLAPPKTHPVWRRLREDIARFCFEREKIRDRIRPEEFDPYPGAFLNGDLEDKIYRSNIMLAIEYLAEGDGVGAKECMRNISFIKEAIPKFDPYKRLCELKKLWSEIVEIAGEREEIRGILR
jgi:glycosyltransferase involved in cell wall biosynthesis